MRAATGIDRLLADEAYVAHLRRQRVGLLGSLASVSADYTPTSLALARAIGSGQSGLVRLFAPEHGWSGVAPEGARVGDDTDPVTGLPVHSLYGPRRAPDSHALAGLDAIIVDLQDVGVRCYTYMTTAALLIESLIGSAVEVVVCDRPNPLGRKLAGPGLDPALRSFIGYLPARFQHGRRLGRMLAAFAQTLGDAPPIRVISAPARRYAPPQSWLPPSPGLPDWEAVLLYPGLVLLEGTCVSEGRGTPSPFRCAVAPRLDGVALAAAVNGWPDTGVRARPTRCTPARGKFRGEICDGVQFHLEPRASVDALGLGVRLTHWLHAHYRDFSWLRSQVPVPQPHAPLAFSMVDGFMVDYLLGDDGLRLGINAGDAPAAIMASWAAPAPRLRQ